MRRKAQNGNKSSAAATWAPKQGRPTQAIIENNRKTELCRNWQKGACTYGGRCAFAHGAKELKYRTLREMENAGRIPDASKYRCYPCMTWVATGSCPYASRCVFIHDLRVKGPVEAWLYAGCLAKSPTACPSSDSFFFFPDIARDPDSTELPTHPAQYDLDPPSPVTGETSGRAVYNLWYSFVSTLIEEASTAGSEATPAPTPASVSTGKAPKVGGPASPLDGTAANKRTKNYAAVAAAALAAAKATSPTAGRKNASKLSQVNGKLVTTSAADVVSPTELAHCPGSSGSTASTTSNSTKAATANSSTAAATTGSQQSARQRRLLRENRRPRGSIRHLPVFEALSEGISMRPPTPLSPAIELAGKGRLSISLDEGAGSSFWDDSGSEGLLPFGFYPSSCAGSSHSLDTEDISMPPTPRLATEPSTDSESYISPSPELRCHIYSCEHLRLLQPGRLPPATTASFNRVDSWKSDSAGNPSDINPSGIGGQPCDNTVKIQDSGGGSVVLEEPPSATASVATASVRSGYAVVHHRQQACAGRDSLGRSVDAAQHERSSIHAVPSF